MTTLSFSTRFKSKSKHINSFKLCRSYGILDYESLLFNGNTVQPSILNPGLNKGLSLEIEVWIFHKQLIDKVFDEAEVFDRFKSTFLQFWGTINREDGTLYALIFKEASGADTADEKITPPVGVSILYMEEEKEFNLPFRHPKLHDNAD